MPCILMFKWIPGSISKVLGLWKESKSPQEVKLTGRLLMDRHTSVAIFDAPNEEAPEVMDKMGI